jgi:hypothetical protein
MQRILWMLRDLVVSLALASVLVAVPAVLAQTSEALAPPKFRKAPQGSLFWIVSWRIMDLKRRKPESCCAT